MDIVSEVVKDGVVERRFDLKVGTEVVPFPAQWDPKLGIHVT